MKTAPFLFFDDGNRIPGFGVSFFQNNDENSFTRHNTVSGLLTDRAVSMAFLADLCNLAQRTANLQLCADGELVKYDPFAQDIFCKCTGKKRDADLLLQFIYALLPEQADLSMPIPGMGVSVDAILWTQMNTIDRMFLLPFFLADADSFDDGGLIVQKNTPIMLNINTSI